MEKASIGWQNGDNVRNLTLPAEASILRKTTRQYLKEESAKTGTVSRRLQKSAMTTTTSRIESRFR